MFSQDSYKEVTYPVKMCIISRTDIMESVEIAKSIYGFFTYIFKNEEKHIMDLLKSDQT